MKIIARSKIVFLTTLFVSAFIIAAIYLKGELRNLKFQGKHGLKFIFPVSSLASS